MKVDKILFFTIPSPGFIGGALLAMLLIVDPIHAGWLVEEQKLTVSDPATIDFFGNSIAVSGNTAVIGAYKDDEKGEDAGAAYIFVRTGAIWFYEKPNWSMQAKLMASDAADQDNFGSSVAIEGDTVVIGTRSTPGSAYAYVRNGDIWSEQAKLISPSSGANKFGSRVGVSDNTAVISGSRSVEGKQRGAVYVFSRSESIWTYETTLDALDSSWARTFGSSIDVDNDNTILVGAVGDDNVGRAARGAAFIFTRTSNLNWDRGKKLYPSAGHGSYGATVALDDNTAIVGGSRYPTVFVRPDSDNQGDWTEQATLTSPDEENNNRFVSHVAVSGDIALIGADGAAYTFSRNGTNWGQKTKLMPSKSAAETRGFGTSGGISSATAAVNVGDLPSNIAVVGRGFYSSTSTRSSAFAFDLDCAPNIVSTLGIPNNQWLMIGLPCDPGEHNTVAEVFGDEIPGTYDIDWVMFRYTTSGYEKLNSNSSMNQKEGYWIIQRSGNEILIDLPSGSTPTLVSNPEGCLASAKGCFEIPLTTQANSDHFNLINYPFWMGASFGNARVVTDAGACATGCDLDTAKSQGILHNELFTYNGEGYDKITTSGDLSPLKAYWALTLDSADGANPRLLIPKP
jgi:hypothetical protein